MESDLAAVVAGVATVLVAALGYLATVRTRRAEAVAAQQATEAARRTAEATQRAADVQVLRDVITELRAENKREREDYDRETERLRTRIRELESS